MKVEWKKWYCRITIKDKPRKWIGAAYLWPFVVVEDEHSDDIDGDREKETEKHERDHLKQQLELGVILFFILYLYYHLTRGYKNNPFELEANYWEKEKEERPWFSYGWTKYLNNENRRKK